MPLYVEIRTPENVRIRHPLAGMASRADACCRDLLVQGVAILAGTALLSLAASVANRSHTDAMQGLLVFLVIWGYPVLFETLWDGRTPGKRGAGIRVVMRNGQRVGFYASALRNLLRIVDFLPAFHLAGILAVFATRDHQRIGDLAAGTIVIREEEREEGAIPR